MEKTNPKYKAYCTIIAQELKTALGCTEPIALAYAAALMRKELGRLPERSVIEVCGNIIKNAKSVTVPNTGGLKGIEAAVVAGFLVGDSALELEVLSRADDSSRPMIERYLAAHRPELRTSTKPETLYIRITGYVDGDSAAAEIAGSHTNVTSIERNGQSVYRGGAAAARSDLREEYGQLNIRDILDFVHTAAAEDVFPYIERQIRLNSAISEEGLSERSYGANIGKVLRDMYPNNDYALCQAAAAAGSDARMSGCELPVVIVSGSGNQGITACMPVVTYGKRKGCSEEAIKRAVLLSDLVTIHQKTGIGKLSAYCGAVSAGVGAACGVAYLNGADEEVIAHTVVNGVAIASGIICDGAKPSCAAKISTAVYAGLMGYEMFCHGQQFYSGEGIVFKGVENTIHAVGKLAHDGMAETDREILHLMVGGSCL